MSSSQLKFLLDENVKRDLLNFLTSEGYDVTFKPKGLSNGKLAAFSKSEQRIFVTNDEDFTEFTKEKIFSLVWLRTPQDKPESLISSFSKLLKETNSEYFKGKLIIISEDKFEISPLVVSFTK
ncbi:MAG: DUF5615 family PIN-like protein [Nanoarchaeota archaeon]|nr:DUF5615 family PIN-like protein [Nanoarchaeota archaeon]